MDVYPEWVLPEPNSGCWIWTGAVRNGYGVVTVKYKMWSSHRYSWYLRNGPIKNRFICHHCDVRLCVNVDHMFVGTCGDNTRDAVEKGLIKPLRGEDNPSHKLSVSQVLIIRNDRRRQADIAIEFGIDGSTVSLIQNKRRWGHL